jgi:predicted GNAT superfamily acetyltransferase
MFSYSINDQQFVIREAQDASDYEAIEDIQREAWGFEDIDIVPGDMLIASQHAGAIVLGAFEGERMLGFAYGFPALEEGHLSIHSHMLAVRPEARNLQIGFYLKLEQRRLALEKGIDEITWTFDPLQSLNAHLNFVKLGVVSHRYLVNFYGETTSSPLHQGFGTDRLWVSWLLNSERVKHAIESGAASSLPPGFSLDDVMPLVVRAEGDQPQVDEALLETIKQPSCRGCFIEIPHNINALKERQPPLGRLWREATRQAFLNAVNAGFTVSDLLKLPTDGTPRWFYKLSR